MAYAVAASRNARSVLDDAELLSTAGRSGRAYSLAVLAVEEAGKAMEVAALAGFPASFRQRVPLRRLLEWHQMKLAEGLLLTALPFGSIASRIAAMPAGELARTLRNLAPADESDRLRLRGLYVDMERDGQVRAPPEVTRFEATGSVSRARKAAASAGGLILAPGFQAWVADPPAVGLELARDLFTALTEAKDAETSKEATDVIRLAIARYRARRFT